MINIKVNKDGSCELPPLNAKVGNRQVSNLPLDDAACHELGYLPLVMPDGYRFVNRGTYNTIITVEQWEAEEKARIEQEEADRLAAEEAMRLAQEQMMQDFVPPIWPPAGENNEVEGA